MQRSTKRWIIRHVFSSTVAKPQNLHDLSRLPNSATALLGFATSYAVPVTFDQSRFDLRCEWRLQGLQALAPESDVIIIVDVLVFSTSVDIALAAGASVFPYRWRDQSAQEFAEGHHALLASPRSRKGGYSCRPHPCSQYPPEPRWSFHRPTAVPYACTRATSRPSPHASAIAAQWRLKL